MSAPTTTNSAATIFDSLIKGAETSIIGLTYNAIIAAVPWLGLPVIKQVWTGIFAFIADYFTRQAELGATFAVIDTQVNEEELTFNQALAALKAAQTSGDPNAISVAEKNFINAATALGSYDGSATPQ
jgi:hypothetical protein